LGLRLLAKQWDNCGGNGKNRRTGSLSAMQFQFSRAVRFVAAMIVLAETQAAFADTVSGERLARRWCASCHLVASDQRQASADVPAFAAIARKPGFDRNKVAFFLLDPHPKMPDLSLTRAEASDLAEYIASLATAR
jgi:mono/diheme cytochrome c family protein